MNPFNFEYPWFLALIVLFIFCAKLCKIKGRSIYFPHLESLLVSTVRRSRLLGLLKWLAIVMALIAMASPVLTNEYSDSKKDGRDIVLIIDTSGSMQQGHFDAKDLSKNKFDVVKEVASDFVLRRENDRIGLITFADVAFVASPLTFGKEFLEKIIKMQRLGIAGQKTAMNDALVQSYAMLERSTAKSKVAILLTDGIDNMSQVSADEVKSLIAKSDVKLYTIGIGSTRDYDGKSLRVFAKAGQGEAFTASNSEMLHQIYAKIDALEVTKIDDKKVVQHTYLFVYPLFIAVLSLLLFLYFRVMGSVK
ncbi:VWA domain-containing protein [bacterium]|nr:VWA domain-containing protein [bacterium]MBU1958815.1 VWA domain-containing protein [bacterium]